LYLNGTNEAQPSASKFIVLILTNVTTLKAAPITSHTHRESLGEIQYHVKRDFKT